MKFPPFLSLFLTLSFVGAWANSENSDKMKSVYGTVIPDHYIVTLASDANVDAVLEEKGLSAQHKYKENFKGFSGRFSKSQLSEILKHKKVFSVEPDQVMQLSPVQLSADESLLSLEPGSEANATWGLDRIDQRALPLNQTYDYNYTATGIKVYVVDTGIRYTHQDFGGRAQFGFDAFGGNGVDCNGHGTHVAGTIGGQAYGVAKNASLIGVRVLDCAGSGSYSGIISALDWMRANHGTIPAVANMSLGGAASTALDTALKNLIASGVTVAVAAGNSNTDACKSSPSRVREAITVGASTNTDAKASFSNHGICVDLFAPGLNISSTWNSSDVALNTISGTSMASPHTAGVAALYLSAQPTASPAEVWSALSSRLTLNKIILPSKLQRSGTTKSLLYSLGF